MERYEFEFDREKGMAEMKPSYTGDYYFQGDVEELIKTLREYLSYDSTDGRKQRQPLRKQLKELIKE